MAGDARKGRRLPPNLVNTPVTEQLVAMNRTTGQDFLWIGLFDLRARFQLVANIGRVKSRKIYRRPTR